MTAVLDSPASETDDLQEVFRRVLAVDAAVERSVAGQETPGDILLLQDNGLCDPEAVKREWEQRIKGLRYRQARAGSNSQLAAAERRIVETEKAFADQDRVISPKIERLRAELQRLEKERQDSLDAITAAHEAVKEMRFAREVIADRCLPPILKRLQWGAVKRSLERYKPQIAGLSASMAGRSWAEQQEIKNKIQELQKRAAVEADTSVWECYLPKDPE